MKGTKITVAMIVEELPRKRIAGLRGKVLSVSTNEVTGKTEAEIRTASGIVCQIPVERLRAVSWR